MQDNVLSLLIFSYNKSSLMIWNWFCLNKNIFNARAIFQFLTLNILTFSGKISISDKISK